MMLLKYRYWQDDEMWLGYLEEYPDYMTQGENMEELLENLKDIYQELISDSIPSVRPLGIVSVNAVDRLHKKADWAYYLTEKERGGLGAALEFAIINFVFDTLVLKN